MSDPAAFWPSAPMPAPAAAPPIVPGMLSRPVREPSWPIAIGIISMVAAVFGLLYSAWALAATWFFSGNWGSGPAPQLDLTLSGVLHVCGIVLAIMLFVSGLYLTMRRPWTRVPLLLWATLKAIQSVSLVAAQYMVFSIEPGAFVVIMGMLAMAWSLALPVFVGIWFMRRSVRDTMARWRRPSVQPAASVVF